MNEEPEPERRTIHIFDIDMETGDVPVRELHVVREAGTMPCRTSLVSIDLSRALKKLSRFDEGSGPS